MKLTAKAQEVAAQILDAFKSGAVPKALALTFLAHHHDSPGHRWSFPGRRSGCTLWPLSSARAAQMGVQLRRASREECAELH